MTNLKRAFTVFVLVLGLSAPVLASAEENIGNANNSVVTTASVQSQFTASDAKAIFGDEAVKTDQLAALSDQEMSDTQAAGWFKNFWKSIVVVVFVGISIPF